MWDLLIPEVFFIPTLPPSGWERWIATTSVRGGKALFNSRFGSDFCLEQLSHAEAVNAEAVMKSWGKIIDLCQPSSHSELFFLLRKWVALRLINIYLCATCSAFFYCLCHKIKLFQTAWALLLGSLAGSVISCLAFWQYFTISGKPLPRSVTTAEPLHLFLWESRSSGEQKVWLQPFKWAAIKWVAYKECFSWQQSRTVSFFFAPSQNHLSA